MDLYKELRGEALDLARAHQDALDRLPRTFLVNTLIELEKWPVFFEPEKAYFRALVNQLGALDAAQLREMFGRLEDFESRTGSNRTQAGDLDALQMRTLEQIQRRGEYARWRQEIDRIFARLEPMLEARLYSGNLPPRLVVIVYAEGIAIERNSLWKRFQGMGTRVPLDLGGAESSEPFLRSLFTGRAARPTSSRRTAAPESGLTEHPAPTLFNVLRQSQSFSPLDTWIIEAGDALHALCEKSGLRSGQPGPEAGQVFECATGMSYDRLRSYRERLTDTIYSKVLTGLRSPLELAAYVKNLDVRPREGLTLYADPAVTAFVRDAFLAGNGTLIINNTFVEWGSVRALKRAQPRLLVARFGVRDKMKPFSSLLLFSKPRSTDQIPILQDPLGSFVDVELLSYYIWLNGEKGPPYKGKTLYLLLAEGVDEMLAVRPAAAKPLTATLTPATLPDVATTMAQWLGATLPGSPGRLIEPLLS